MKEADAVVPDIDASVVKEKVVSAENVIDDKTKSICDEGVAKLG